MKKLFTFLMALLLSVGSMWATTYTTTQAYTNSRDLAASSWKNAFDASDPVDLYRLSYAVSKSAAPMLRLDFVISKSDGLFTYANNVKAPKPGRYPITNTLATGSVISYANNSYYSLFSPNNSTIYQLSSGTVVIEEGTEGPRITFENTVTNTVSRNNYKIQCVIGTEKPKYNLTLNVNNSNMGVVSGAGAYIQGKTAIVLAMPKDGYRFVSWSDGGAQRHEVTMNAAKTLTATFEADCAGQAAGTALPSASYAAFKHGDKTQIAFVKNENEEWYWGKSSSFVCVVGHDKSKTTKNYIQMNFWVDAEHQQLYAEGMGPKEGVYDVPETQFIVEDDYGYWYLPETMKNTVVAGYYKETNYGFGVAPMSSFGAACNNSTGAIDESSYAKFNDAKIYVESGKDGNIYIRAEKNGGTLFTFGEPRVGSYSVQVAGDGNGSVSVNKPCPYFAGTQIQLTATENTGYQFAHWSDGNTDNPRSITVNANINLTAEFEPLPTHTVTFESSNAEYGTVSLAAIENVEDGATITVNNNQITIGSTTVTATAAEMTEQYTYSFTGWTNAEGTVDDDMTITANFGRETRQYHVIFKDETGDDILYEYDVEYGSLPTYGGVTPTKEAEAQYTYTFNNWGAGLVTVTRDTTYRATYTQTTRQYTITIPAATNGTIVVKNGEVVVNDGDKVDYGTNLTVTATPDEHYHFVAWTNDGAASVTVDGDKTIGATFAINTNLLTWNLAGGSIVAPGYTEAGQVAYGTELEAPMVEKDGYNFIGWTPNVDATMPDAAATYTAQWEAAITYYTVTLTAGEGGTVALYSDEECNSAIDGVDGVYTVEANATVYAKATANDQYQFQGWTMLSDGGEGDDDPELDAPIRRAAMDDMPGGNVGGGGEANNPLEIVVTTDVAYTANFEIKYREITLTDGADSEDYCGTKGVVNLVTLNREFPTSSWSTICLPFDVNVDNMYNAKLNGKIYDFIRATGNATVGMTLYFERVDEMQAGVPYLFWSKQLVRNPWFEDVEFMEDADEVGTKESDDIDMVGTLTYEEHTSSEANYNQIMGLSKNKIYYAPSSGVNVRAYRAYFRLNGGRSSIAPRIRIVTEDMESELEIVNDELVEAQDVRKYVENGVLVIERNGIRYTAQGARID